MMLFMIYFEVKTQDSLCYNKIITFDSIIQIRIKHIQFNGNDLEMGLYLNGNIAYACQKRDSILTGFYYEFYPSGKIMTNGNFSSDSIPKSAVLYEEVYLEENGLIELKIIRSYNGLKHGEWRYYNDNGCIYIQGEYFYGKRHGEWKYYDENCKLIKREFYKEGKIDN